MSLLDKYEEDYNSEQDDDNTDTVFREDLFEGDIG